jgi:hypothetical protein
MIRTAAVMLAILAASPALTKDVGQWIGQPAETRQWFNGLTNGQGGQCCSFADGVSIEDPDWRITPAGTYQVFYKSRWRDVLPEAVVRGPNRIGHAVLWPVDYSSTGNGVPAVTIIRCFLPGVEG